MMPLRPCTRGARALLAMALLAPVAFTLTLAYGDFPISPLAILRCLLHLPGTTAEQRWVLMDLRLPRNIIAWLVGAALGLGGAILQALTRNPLAEPGLMGVASGASVAAVALLGFYAAAPAWMLPAAAFAGAMAALSLLFALTARGGSPRRMLLAGVALSALLGAVTNLLLLYTRSLSLEHVSFWLAGSLAGKSWPQLWPLAAQMAVLVPLTIAAGRDLNALAAGDEIATVLGVPRRGCRVRLLLLCAALTAVAVATAGPISFVGIVAPNIARRIVGAWQSRLLPAAALLGAALVALADVAGRALTRGVEIPCGLVTAAMGGICLYFMLAKNSPFRMSR